MVAVQLPLNHRLRGCDRPIKLLAPPRRPRQAKLSNKKLGSDSNAVAVAALSKQGQRFLSSVATAGSGGDASSATSRLIKKFVAASPKGVAIDALSHLISPGSSHSHLSSSLALPLYTKISEASWFEWNPKLVANLVAFLDKQGQYKESAALVSDSISKLQFRERDLTLFYCNLIESHSKHGSDQGFDDAYARLNQLVSDSNSVYVKQQGCKSMINGLCEMGRPKEAEDMIKEMRGKGLKPSLFEFRCVLYGYGRLGLFEDMQRTLDEIERKKFKVDTVCSNMVLSSYGAHRALPEMVLWLQKMKKLGIPFSVRTYNSVLNSCPTIMSLMGQQSNTCATSIEELMKILTDDEAMLVKELVASSVLDEAMKWDASEGKLDLHGMHVSTSYLILLQWMEDMRNKLNNGKHIIPVEITLVCGSGNHSNVRGESPVKRMIKELMVRTSSPMRVDKKNTGCFVAKGKVVKEWLS